MTPAARGSPPPSRSLRRDRARAPARRRRAQGWGLAHRFAGSGDRAAIAGLVYDALRRRASSAYPDGRRDAARGPARHAQARARARRRGDRAACRTARAIAPAPLTDDERARLDGADLAGAPRACRRRLSGMARRRISPAPSATTARRRAPRSPRARRSICASIRSRASASRRRRCWPTSSRSRRAGRPGACASACRADAKSPAIHAEPAFLKGLVEVQDEGSQLAALFAGAKPGEQVVDLCAGAGGKTLALAADDGEQGPDLRHRRRQAPAGADPRPARRARARATCRCARPNRSAARSTISRAACDLVLIDAPCTGTGAWRRNPDAKWRMRPGALEQRAEGTGRSARPRRADAQSRRPHRLHHLLGARRGERRPGARISRAPPGLRGRAAGRGRRRRWASAPSCSPRRRGSRQEGLLMTPRGDRYRRIFRQHSARLEPRLNQNDMGTGANSPIAPQSRPK